MELVPGSSSKRCWWRIVKLNVILSFLPQGSNSIFEFATNIKLRMSLVPAQNLCVSTHVPPPCFSLLAQNFDGFHDEKTTLFRHTGGGRGPIGCWREEAPAGATGHTLQLKSSTRQTMLKNSIRLKRSVCSLRRTTRSKSSQYHERRIRQV
jgi:hypothetical protein